MIPYFLHRKRWIYALPTIALSCSQHQQVGFEYTHVDVYSAEQFLVELGLANQLGELCDMNNNFETNSLEQSVICLFIYLFIYLFYYFFIFYFILFYLFIFFFIYIINEYSLKINIQLDRYFIFFYLLLLTPFFFIVLTSGYLAPWFLFLS